jgi:hypothetical protein
MNQPQVLEQGRAIVMGAPMTIAGPPEDFGAVVGDVVHNLRAALDLMACDLVRAGNGDPKNVYFPFCDRPEDLDKVLKDKNFNRAGAKAIALLKELKPYRGGNVALRAIHDLDIQDKHKSLIPAVTVVTGQTFRVDVQDGKASFVPIADSGPRTSFNFPDGPFKDQEIIPTLHELMKLTASVVEAFAAL